MSSIRSLRNRLAADYPELTFVDGSEYRWDPTTATVHIDTTTDDPAALLHELGHALLRHHDYSRDITLLAMERDAWTHAASTLAPRYHLTIDDDTIQDALDTYRDWLHSRSQCPDCRATGIQSAQHTYKCIACRATWRVNDARTCALRRYKQRP